MEPKTSVKSVAADQIKRASVKIIGRAQGHQAPSHAAALFWGCS